MSKLKKFSLALNAKDLASNTLVGRLAAGDDFNTAVQKGWNQALDPLNVLHSSKKISRPKWGEKSSEADKRLADKKKEEKAAMMRKRAGMKKGGQVKKAKGGIFPDPVGQTKRQSSTHGKSTPRNVSMKCGGKTKKMAKGGKTVCRGMGAATRGGNFSKDG